MKTTTSRVDSLPQVPVALAALTAAASSGGARANETTHP